MPRSGITILSDTLGAGREIKNGDRVRVLYDIQLNRGDYLEQDATMSVTIGRREIIAGFRYGLEGMRAGGSRMFKASPHLCYRDQELNRIPKNAVLIINIKALELMK